MNGSGGLRCVCVCVDAEVMLWPDEPDKARKLKTSLTMLITGIRKLQLLLHDYKA